MRLVSCLGRDLTDGVDKVDAGHPLVVGELDFTSKVVEVAKEAAEENAVSGRHVGAHCVDNMLCEVGVETAGAAVGAVGSHDVSL